jgi:hypothetical protein
LGKESFDELLLVEGWMGFSWIELVVGKKSRDESVLVELYIKGG